MQLRNHNEVYVRDTCTVNKLKKVNRDGSAKKYTNKSSRDDNR